MRMGELTSTVSTVRDADGGLSRTYGGPHVTDAGVGHRVVPTHVVRVGNHGADGTTAYTVGQSILVLQAPGTRQTLYCLTSTYNMARVCSQTIPLMMIIIPYIR